MKKNTRKLFDYLEVPEENKGIILDELNCFEAEDLAIIKKNCGENFDGNSKEILTSREKYRIYTVLLDRLSEGYRTLVDIKDDLEKYKQTLIDLHEQWKKRRKVDDLVSYLENLYTVLEIKQVLSKYFTLKEIELIYSVCGENLRGQVNSNVSREEHCKFTRITIPKLKKRLCREYPGRATQFDTGALYINKNISAIENMVEEITPSAVESESTISMVEEIIEPKVEIVAQDKEQEAIINDSSNENEVRAFVSTKKEFTKADYEFVANIINSAEFKELLKLRFSAEEVMVATLIYYGYQDKKYTVQEIAEFLNTTVDDVIDIARRTLKAYNELVASKLDMYEQELKKTYK